MITVRTLGVLEVCAAAGQPVAIAPKPLALLVYLALARPAGPQRRDRLVALFYPETDEHHGRHSLRQLLTKLRAVLGADLLTLGDRETTGIDRTTLACDAWTFEQALAAGDFAAAVAAYGGPFLEGFHLAGCPDFEEWADAERMRLRRGLTGALEQLALRASAEGRAPEAADWWRRLLAHEPYASSVTLGLMEALARAGDRAGALEAARAHAQRLREELGATPSSEVAALAEQLQAKSVEHTGTTPTVAEQLASALAGRYRLEGLVAVGGMALVYKAEDLAHVRPVAIKVLRPELAAVLGPDRFLQEIAVTAQLDHPGIVPLYDSGRSGGEANQPAEPSAIGDRPAAALLYYVMPFIAGESLRARLEREGPLPLEDALRITREVAEALGHAHARGIVHRDIKPENILLTGGHAVVADFGIARALEQAGTGTVTAPGVALGTPAYMSPEQAGARGAVDARSDVYALGCVLYELLAGHPPFHGTTAQELLARHATDPVPSLRAARVGVPEPVEATAYTALAKAPADRFATAKEFGAALTLDVAAYHRRQTRRRTVRRIGVGLAVTTALVTLGMLGRSIIWPSGKMDAAYPLPYTVMAEVGGSAPAALKEVVRRRVGAELEQAGLMQVLPPWLVRMGLASAMLPASTPLVGSLPRELAVRGNVPSVVAVTLDRLGDTYTLTLRVIVAELDSTLATTNGTAGVEDGLVAMVSDAVRDLKRRIGGDADDVTQRGPVGFRAGTASFEAFLLWRECRRWGNVNPSRAIPECRRALALDSTFAQAWYDLGRAYHQWRRLDSAFIAFREALRHGAQLNETGRRSAEAVLHYLKGDLAAAARAWEPIAPNSYCFALYNAGQLQDALQTPVCSQDLVDPLAPGGTTRAVEYARTLVAAGQPDSARRVTRLNNRSSRERVEHWIATAARDWSAADSLGRLHTGSVEIAPVVHLAAVQSLASARAARGAVGEAQRILAANRDAGPIITKARVLLQVVSGAAMLEPGPNADAAGTEEAVHAAMLAAVDRDTALAQLLLDRAFATDSSGELALVLLGPRQVTRALVHSQADAWQAVLDDLRPLRERLVLNREVELLTRWLTAVAFERLGNADSAASYFERVVNPEPLLEESVQVGLPYSFAHFRLGGIYSQLGQYNRAKEHYGTFLETFTEPDPEYVWMVTEARAQLDELARKGQGARGDREVPG